MSNWYDVAPPHEDIRRGDFDEAVFAAKLGDVVTGDAPEDYSDPYAFFKKTYLTAGLEKLLQQVYKKLSKGRGPGIVQLKTPFGGGKTHALILVYHYLANGGRVEELFPADVGLLDPSVAAIVGTDINPSEGFRSGDVVRKTLWGEIAYQLGGEQAYATIKANDKNRISPGRTDLRDMLEPLQPFTILLDEVLEYIVRARAIEIGDSTLAAQTLSFLQELTEAVSDIKHGLLIATLPSSEQEDFGESEQQNLAKVEKIFGRLEAIYTPVQGEEVYSIIRRRLFEAPDEAEVRSVVDQYISKYQQHKKELPTKATAGGFRNKMELAYPFHPEVIDILYEKWSTFTSFQRTRGALALLARVIEDLYEREQAIDLILPSDLNLGDAAIRNGFLKHIGNEYEGVIDSDIAGDNAKSKLMDQENRSWNHLAERNATSIFLHSFSADKSDRGIPVSYVKLDVARPDTTMPLVSDVLMEQSKELWYLNSKGEEYYFSDVPNLNRMVITKKDQVQDTAVRKELKTRIQNELGSKLKTYLWPSSGDELPDNQELKLAVLDPRERYDERALRQWVDRKGQSYRAYKNTIIFAVPDGDRHVRLLDTIKQYLALQDILSGIESGKYPGLEEKKGEVKRRRDNIVDDFPLKVRELHHIAMVPVVNGGLEEIDFGQPAVGRENLDSWFRKTLASQMHGKILGRPPSANLIRAKFLRNGDAIGLQEVVEQFYKNTSLPALDNPSLIAETVANGVREGSFALARQEDGSVIPESVRINEALSPSQVSFQEEGWVLVTVARAKELLQQVEPEYSEQPAQPKPGTAQRSGDGGTTVQPHHPTSGSSPSEGETTEQKEAEEKVNRLQLRASGIPSSKLIDLHRGVIKPITREVGEFDFAIEIDVSSAEGIPKKVIEQAIMETLQQLGADVNLVKDE